MIYGCIVYDDCICSFILIWTIQTIMLILSLNKVVLSSNLRFYFILFYFYHQFVMIYGYIVYDDCICSFILIWTIETIILFRSNK